jgi:hypothetical protein
LTPGYNHGLLSLFRKEEDSMKTLFKSAAALALLVGSVSSTATTHGRGESKITFWDSEDYNYIVGYNLFYCDGHFQHVGSYSLYSTEEYFGCD